MAQRMQQIGNRGDGGQNYRHLHRQPASRQDAEEAHQPRIGRDQRAAADLSPGERLPRCCEHDRDGDQCEGERHKRALKRKEDANIRQRADQRHQTERQRKRDPCAIRQDDIRDDEQQGHDHFDPRLKAVDAAGAVLVAV